MRLFGYDESAMRAILGEARLRYRKIMDCHSCLAGIPGISDMGMHHAVETQGVIADVPEGQDSQRAVPQHMALPGALPGSGNGSTGVGVATTGDLMLNGVSGHVVGAGASASVASGARASERDAPKAINAFFGSSRVA